MIDEPELDRELGTPFADLVRKTLARRKLSYRGFEALAVDPKTGYAPPHTLVWKIDKGQPVKISPALCRAVAVVAERPVREVQIAAAAEYIGLVADDPFGESVGDAKRSVAHVPGLTADDMPLVRDLLRKLEGGAA
ncbi:hypothetical protein [Streptomyces sp. NPDC097981]|uniref:hypothetical protein n=1 Tax=Streptomyces sp. NPDC097981 TaxID=3155428 RepID=UPI003316F242